MKFFAIIINGVLEFRHRDVFLSLIYVRGRGVISLMRLSLGQPSECGEYTRFKHQCKNLPR